MNKNGKTAFILIILIVAASASGLFWWKYSKTHISTDDAFVDSHTFTVSSRVPGRILEVYVNDNRQVKKGELLAMLDPSDFEQQVKEAEASLVLAKNETSGEYALVEAAKAGVSQANAAMEQATLDLKRAQSLYSKDVIPKDQLDRLTTALKVAEARYAEASQKLKREEANLGLAKNGGKEARIAQREAKLNQAKLNLSYTRIYAPSDGYVTKKTMDSGNFVQPGQPLMSIVDLENIWITANYKESQLTDVKPGQPVEFEVDTYPGKKFIGKVDSLMAGTGSAFALLPPENASGNFVKVVQRIPVKILIDPSSLSKSQTEHVLRVGMSVAPTILTEKILHRN